MSLLCVVLVKCLFVVVVAVFICYAVWVFRSSLGRLSTSPFCLFYFTAPVSIGATTSSAKKLPHRVVTLKSTDKGEEEMAF